METGFGQAGPVRGNFSLRNARLVKECAMVGRILAWLPLVVTGCNGVAPNESRDASADVFLPQDDATVASDALPDVAPLPPVRVTGTIRRLDNGGNPVPAPLSVVELVGATPPQT